MSEWTPADIDLALTREFWRHGERPASAPSSIERRTRIRVSILRDKRERVQFYDSGLTYMQAYQQCYGIALELRRLPREPPPVHHVEARDYFEPGDDLEAHDDSEDSDSEDSDSDDLDSEDLDAEDSEAI
jgi:hypothetical protein